jgi:hypothetical protein
MLLHLFFQVDKKGTRPKIWIDTKSEISKPTINMYTTEHTLRSIIDSSDSRAALIEALIDGDIKYEGVGIVDRGKFFVIKQGSKII